MLENCWQDSYSGYCNTGLHSQQETCRGSCDTAAGRTSYQMYASWTMSSKTQYEKISNGSTLWKDRPGTHISPAFGEHPIDIFAELVAHRFARKIEECADLVPVDLDIHGSVTSRGIRGSDGQMSVTLSIMPVKMSSSRRKETQISCTQYPTSHQPWSQETTKLERRGSTYDPTQHTLTKTDEQRLHSTNTHFWEYHKRSDPRYHTAISTLYSYQLDRSYAGRTSPRR